MALAYTDLTTEIDDADTDNWTGDPTVGLDTDFAFEGSGAIGIDVDIETHIMKSSDFTAIDMTGQTLMAMLNCFTSLTLDTKANGGMGIGVEDSTGAQDFWYVGGIDTYDGGWKGFAASLSETPDVDGSADHTDITNVLVRWKCVAKSKLTQNCFVDFVRRINDGDPCFRISGTNATTDLGWSEIADLDATNTAGLFVRIPGGYSCIAPFALGDGGGATTTAFTEAQGESLVWLDMPVAAGHYGIICQGNGTGTTNITIGNVVGSGDDRQGVKGGTISTAGPSWTFNCATDIADLDTVNLYGINFSGARKGFDLDDGNKTTIVSCIWANCGNIVPGTTNSGAELLSCTIIDPEDDDDSGNSGLLLQNTTHNLKKISLITSGTPTTQHMIEFTQAADYSITLSGFNWFGSYASSTIWHGENSGLNADVTVNPTDGSNPTESEFENTDSGTVTVSTTPVTALVNVKDNTKTNLQNARVYLKASSGAGPMPFQDSVTITRSGTVATAAHTAHGMETGDKVVLKGITDKTEDNNGTHTITVTGSNAYTFVTTDSGSTSYTGTIISTWVAIDALTDASGNASRVKSYLSDQPVDGWARKSTASPRFKSFPIAGTIDNADGLSINVQMVLNE